MSMVDEAIIFAAKTHAGQRRKYTNEPYVAHCIEVMTIVNSVPHTDEMLAAAVLHDTVEDTDATHDDICANFGFSVGKLVFDLTDIFTSPEMGNRAKRKSMECQRLGLTQPDAQTIKLADLISNTRTIVQYDPGFATLYLAEKRALLDVLTKGDRTLHRIAVDQCRVTDEE